MHVATTALVMEYATYERLYRSNLSRSEEGWTTPAIYSWTDDYFASHSENHASSDFNIIPTTKPFDG